MTEQKQRHGCLTAWLMLLIIANSVTAMLHLLGNAALEQKYPDAPEWAFPALTGLCFANLVCVSALLRWKKWGFFGYILTSIVAVFVNMAVEPSVLQAVFALLGVALLYGVLQIGNRDKGWTQLE